MPGSTDNEEASGNEWHEGAEGDGDDISDGLPAYEQAEDYDPDADDKDQAFIDKRRCNRRSDAHLSCPGCLTTVCVDCQAHAFKDGQFRAMFAINARVDSARKIESFSTSGKKGKRRRDQQQAHEESRDEQAMSSVLCAVCGVLLGAQDADEIYHFFHVVATTA